MDLKFHIPPELESAVPEIRRFIDAMLFKLRKNAHKGKWDNMHPDIARQRMSDELHELDQAFKENNSVEILLEAADVANFCLILSNIMILQGQK